MADVVAMLWMWRPGLAGRIAMMWPKVKRDMTYMKVVFVDRRAVVFASKKDEDEARRMAALWTGLPHGQARVEDGARFAAACERAAGRLERDAAGEHTARAAAVGAAVPAWLAEDFADNVLVLCASEAAAEAAFEQFKQGFEVIRAGGGLVKFEGAGATACGGADASLRGGAAMCAASAASPKYLYIFRRGFWDLPKGKQEKGEDIRDTALREVQEETGLKHLTLGEELPTTYHLIRRKHAGLALKECVWYKMTATAKTHPSAAGVHAAHVPDTDTKAHHTTAPTLTSTAPGLASTSPHNIAPPKLRPQTEEDIEQALWLTPSEVLSRTSEMYPSIALLSYGFVE